MPTILNINTSRGVDLNGFAVPGALATFYNSGTTDLRTVYADSEMKVPHPSPVVANGSGVFPPVFDTGGSDVKVVITDAWGAVLPGYPLDPAFRVSTNIVGASSVSFEPTSDVPETNMQDAIERVQQNIVAPLAGFGIGVSGNAPILSNIDVTNTASGFYRYDSSTKGTFPESNSTGGIVSVWRQTGSRFLQQLIPTAGKNFYQRSFYENEFSAWVRLITSEDVLSDDDWIKGISDTEAVVSPQAIRSTVQAINSDAEGIGSPVFARYFGSEYAGYGSVVSGSLLRPSNDGSGNAANTLPGKWRVMGTAFENTSSLFVRVE